jgi:hypothetical protein
MTTTRANSFLEEAYPPWITVALGSCYVAAVVVHFRYINGFYAWAHMWRRVGWPMGYLALLPTLLLALLLHSLIPYFQHRRAMFLVIASGLCAATLLASASFEPSGAAYIGKSVVSPAVTSYYTDALQLSRRPGWLADFHLLDLHLHSETHPPGSILYYLAFILVFGPSHAATCAGIVLALLTAFGGVWSVYCFSGLWTPDSRTRLLSVLLFCLTPALVAFYPEFDLFYLALAGALLVSWARSIEGNLIYGVCGGVVLFVITLFAYNLLILGLPLAVFSALQWFRLRKESRLRIMALSAAALAASFVACHLIFKAFTGYHAILSFRRALDNQRLLSNTLLHYRLHESPLVPNIHDFVLGVGVPVAILFLLHLLHLAFNSKSGTPSSVWVWTATGVITLLVLEFSGLLDFETARVWFFLQLFVLVPAALELRRSWTPRQQGLFLVLQWLTMVVVKSNMVFISP